MKKILFLHATAATFSLIIIIIFISSTLVAELFLTPIAIVNVKSSIFKGIFILIPIIILTAISGNILARKRSGKLIQDKQKRMLFIAINGVCILLPAAIFLNHQANLGHFSINFYIVQLLEIIFGILQIILLSKNFYAGLKLRGTVLVK